MWTNYDDAHTKFVELVYAERMSPTQAAKIAVFEARTYKNYHAKLEITLGVKLTRVVSAVDNESTKQFFFRIEAE